MSEYDLAIIGVGAVGSAALLAAARAGAKVIGIDRFHPPHAMGSTHGETRIVRAAIGEGVAYTPFALRSFDLWDELARETGAQLVNRCGLLVLGGVLPHATHVAAGFLETTIEAARRFDIAHEVIGADEVRRRFPDAALAMCTTAGELCSEQGQLYCTTGGSWDRIVLQCFDASLVARAEVVAIPLGSEDLRRGSVAVPMKERVARLARSIENPGIALDIDPRDTFAYVLFDGLSASESFFMEALYESGRFPCLFVGGSAGGTLDFKVSWLHDGKRRLDNHALVTFVRTAPGVRFGVFKSQNFEPTDVVFNVLSASLEQRYVSQVFDQQGRIGTLVDALCDRLKCDRSSLEAKLAEYSFAIRVGKEIYVRSIARMDLDSGRVHFYCDVAPGEELVMVRRTGLAERIH